jgi:hypothetical protein
MIIGAEVSKLQNLKRSGRRKREKIKENNAFFSSPKD